MELDAATFLKQLSDATERFSNECNEEEMRDAEKLLVEAKSYLDPTTATGQDFLDRLGIDLPSVLVKFIINAHAPCQEMATSILKTLSMFCDPRVMFAAYMEALHLYSEPETLTLCSILLDDLPQIFMRMKRRKVEFFQESLPGLMKTYRVAMDSGSQVKEIFDKLANIAVAMHDISLREEVTSKRQKLQQALALFVLLLLAKVLDCAKLDASRFTILKLAKLMPECGISFLDMITGNYVDNIIDCFDEDPYESQSEIWETRQGAIMAVCWSFCCDDEAKEKGDLELFLDSLFSLGAASVTAIYNFSVLLSPRLISLKVVEVCIEFLVTIFESSQAQNLFCSQMWLREKIDTSKLKDLLQAIERVVILSPHSKTRKDAYKVFVQIIRQVLQPMERYEILKLLIMESNVSSMISLLIYIVKEEVEKAISEKDRIGETEENLESPFASKKVLEFIDFVLLPPSGGPPDLPNQNDAVLSVLNLYRFILIRETSGKSNYTGILHKRNLEQARGKWLQPLCTFIEGFRLSLQKEDPETAVYVQLSLANLECVLYRCLELVEEALEHSS